MKILFLHKQILFPRDTGGKIRVLNLLRHLAQWHQVTYVCNLRTGEEQHLPEMLALGLTVETLPNQSSRPGSLAFLSEMALNVFSALPFTIARNFDPAVRVRVQQLVAAGGFDLVICDCVQMARHTVGITGVTRVLFQHNVEAQVLGRQAAAGGSWLRRLYMRQQHRKMCRFEASCGQAFDAVIAVSEPDRLAFTRDYGWPQVDAIDTAVDDDYFQPQPGLEEPNRVLFIGSMDWLPNQDGVRWFVREVWSQVLRSHPTALFSVVGRNPSASVLQLAGNGVEVTGSVPDVRPHLARASVVVVPILAGGGTRLKIYEALAMAKPLVSTTLGAEGLPLTPGEHFLCADQPAEFAAAVSGLLADAERRRALGVTADAYVRTNFGSERVARQFAALCQRAVDRRAGVPV